MEGDRQYLHVLKHDLGDDTVVDNIYMHTHTHTLMSVG